MNSGSCYEHTSFSHWVGHLGRRHTRAACGRAIPAASAALGRDAFAVCDKFSAHGAIGSRIMPAASVAARTMARRRRVDCSANAVARPVLQRIFSCGLSEYGSRVGRNVWWLDALLLRGRAYGRADSRVEEFVKPRPNLLEPEDLPAAPKQSRSLAKHTRLKAAALALFGKKGYENTSVEQIARRAKLAVGGFYRHFRSKRQLLLALMNDLMEKLSQVNLRPETAKNAQLAISEMLSRAFSHDLHYLGAYRAWQEAVASDADLARKDQEIHAWTVARITAVFQLLQQLPGARQGVDTACLARVIDGMFWNLLAQAASMRKSELKQWVDSSAELIYHGLFYDAAKSRR
jgi:AcrR family transcriptional regulator